MELQKRGMSHGNAEAYLDGGPELTFAVWCAPVHAELQPILWPQRLYKRWGRVLVQCLMTLLHHL